MQYRLAINILSLLSAYMVFNTTHVLAEDKSDYPYVDVEALKQEKASASDTNKNLIKQNNKNSLNTSGQRKRSIKMIVGGQSEDGVAKQVTVPVDE